MSVLVTGAAGFIGSHLVDSLLATGEEVVGLDNFDPFYSRRAKERNLTAALDHQNYRMVEGDVRDADLLASLPEDIDAVIHLAALAGVRPSIRDPERYADVNVVGTSQVLRLARDREIRTFLYASSSSVYGNSDRVPFKEGDPVHQPISPYAATKAAGELLCHSATHLHGITTLCLRFFTVYGPRQRPDLAIHKFARLLKAGEAIPVFGDGSTSRDYTYITDILHGLTQGYAWARQAESSHEIVNLGESQTVTLAKMLAVISEELGVEPRIERLPEQPGDVERTYADVTKARALFGYDPHVGFQDGVRAFLAWMDREVS